MELVRRTRRALPCSLLGHVQDIGWHEGWGVKELGEEWGQG